MTKRVRCEVQENVIYHEGTEKGMKGTSEGRGGGSGRCAEELNCGQVSVVRLFEHTREQI